MRPPFGRLALAVVLAAAACRASAPVDNFAIPLDLGTSVPFDLAGLDLTGVDLANIDLAIIGDIAVTCTGGLSPCSGACVDLQGTATDCGRCGHDCAGGQCSGGVCQEVTLTTAVTVGTSFDIATDGVHVLWSSSAGDGSGPGPNTGVYAIATSGTGQTPFPIAPPADYMSPAARPQAMRVAGTTAYWVNYTDPSSVAWAVYRGPVAGGTVNNVTSYGTTGTIATMTVSPTASRVYVIAYSSSNTTSVRDCDPAGSGCTTIVNPVAGVAVAGGATAVADAAYLYWAEWGTGGGIRRFHLGDPASTAPVTLAGPYNTAANLVLDGGYLYWSVGSKIYRTPTTTADPQIVIDTGNNVAGVVAAGPYVVWGDSATGVIRYASSTPGGTAVNLAAGNQIHYNAGGGSGMLARDAGSVYWMNRGDNTIRKVALP